MQFYIPNVVKWYLVQPWQQTSINQAPSDPFQPHYYHCRCWRPQVAIQFGLGWPDGISKYEIFVSAWAAPYREWQQILHVGSAPRDTHRRLSNCAREMLWVRWLLVLAVDPMLSLQWTANSDSLLVAESITTCPIATIQKSHLRQWKWFVGDGIKGWLYSGWSLRLGGLVVVLDMLFTVIGKGWSCSYIMEKQIWDLRSHLQDSRWVKLLADFQVPVASTRWPDWHTRIRVNLSFMGIWICGSIYPWVSHGYTCIDPWVTQTRALP